jgi:ADP-L-glycero-D-manno-heptose 6-epimerase
VKDAVKMTLAVAENPSANGLFNIGSGAAHSWNQLATAVFKALKHAPNIEYIEMPELLREKYQYYTCAEIGKLRDAGYTEAVTSLDEAVRDYVTHYLIPDGRLGERAE